MGTWRWASFGVAGFVVACGASDDSQQPQGGAEPDETGVVDMRTELPPPPPNGRQFLSEEYVIEPGDERQMCVIETYDGPDVGIRSLNTYQTGYGHHVAFLATSVGADEYPDRMPFNCTTDDDFDMALQVPLFLGTAVGLDGINEVTLPDGMAAMMRSGTRVLIQSHYVNTGTQVIRVRDGFNVEFAHVDEVETWAAPFVNTSVTFEVPPMEEHTVEFDCSFPIDLTILYISGHMHEWGSRLHLDLTPEGGPTERFYEVEKWLPHYRDEAPLNRYDLDEFTVKTTDVMRTSCTWNNETDEPLTLPTEMCVSLGMAYPSRDTVMCVK